jgi:hypothetical protein
MYTSLWEEPIALPYVSLSDQFCASLVPALSPRDLFVDWARSGQRLVKGSVVLL